MQQSLQVALLHRLIQGYDIYKKTKDIFHHQSIFLWSKISIDMIKNMFNENKNHRLGQLVNPK